MLFYGIQGEDVYESESGSFFNILEASRLVELIESLLWHRSQRSRADGAAAASAAGTAGPMHMDSASWNAAVASAAQPGALTGAGGNASTGISISSSVWGASLPMYSAAPTDLVRSSADVSSSTLGGHISGDGAGDGIGSAQQPRLHTDDIGVIAPYRKQVEFL